MRRSLRRSCATCAKAKHRCDLQTPRCSRCTERDVRCVYANEPLSSAAVLPPGKRDFSTSPEPKALQPQSHRHSPAGGLLLNPYTLSGAIGARSIDPFDSYPPTNLPRARVQGLIHHFLSKIAFQYYPLDLNPGSNPFITSWWPLALGDPALFHVSLQTASLDDELHAQKGFRHSAILMRDSVSLVRKKIEDPSLAFQDATMDAVVTLAAIEHGQGNLHRSRMHVEAVKRMVEVRGGISKVRETSALTARMVPWVSMLVMGSPQFQVKDKPGPFSEAETISEECFIPYNESENPSQLDLTKLDIDPVVKECFTCLRSIFSQYEESHHSDAPASMSTNDLHDLASFILHRLLAPQAPRFLPTTTSECLRYGISIYLFIIHGPTYYSHAEIVNSLSLNLQQYLKLFLGSASSDIPLSTWLLSVGMVASMGTPEHEWFVSQSLASNLWTWDDVKSHLRGVLWLEHGCKVLFRQIWEQIIASKSIVDTSEFGFNADSGAQTPGSMHGLA